MLKLEITLAGKGGNRVVNQGVRCVVQPGRRHNPYLRVQLVNFAYITFVADNSEGSRAPFSVACVL